MSIVALLPAHNEEDNLPRAIEALRSQTRVPDRIIVIADNCTDRTVLIAQEMRCEVWPTLKNEHKKAGALNQVIEAMIGWMDPEDVFLVQDADSTLDPTFIENGMGAYEDNVGGVGGVFRGRIDASRWGQRMVQAFQTNEYARYELDIRRQKGKVLVLTGTATLLKVKVLREVIEARRTGRLPGEATVYDTKVLTEDNELSFALLHLGYVIKSPNGCTLETETMPTWRDLAKQRNRWKRGALENLFDYGFTRQTRGYWGRQVLAFLGLLVTGAYLGTVVYALTTDSFRLHVFWLAVTALFALERAVTVRRRGLLAMAVGATVVIEMVYDLFLQGVQAKAFAEVALGRERRW